MLHRFITNPGAGQKDAAVSHTSVSQAFHFSWQNCKNIIGNICKSSLNTLANVLHAGLRNCQM